MSFAASPNLGHGFPTPGPQEPTGQNVMDHIFFLNDTQWKEAREFGQYDLIIVGTGFCGLAVAHRTLERNPKANILMIERGTFFLPEHFQNLPSATATTLGGLSETFPWTLDARTASGKDGTATWMHGQLPFFGGRSTTWSAWCPRPTEKELDGWPRSVVDKLYANDGSLFKSAETLLNVQAADKIDGGRCKEVIDAIARPVYKALQKSVQDRLKKALCSGDLKEAGIYRVDPAPIASKSDIGTDFQKFSTTGPLLDLLLKYDNLHIATNCIVSKILRQGTTATALDTSRGIFPIGNAKLVLAMATLPPVTLISNSFPELPNIGKRFSAHCISSIVARVPKAILDSYPTSNTNPQFGSLEVGAMYIAGVADGNFKNQFHIQLSALYDEYPDGNFARAMRYMPDVVATATPEQLKSSKGHVIFVCAALGELDSRNKSNQFLKNDNDADVTTNSILRVVSNGKEDVKTWTAMDESVFVTLEQITGTANKHQLEYWQEGKGWTHDRPNLEMRRVDGLVHESSTLHFGEESSSDAAVNAKDYSLRDIDNIYVTGAGLWPQGASWNPTMTMVALSMDLADQLTPLCHVAPGGT